MCGRGEEMQRSAHGAWCVVPHAIPVVQVAIIVGAAARESPGAVTAFTSVGVTAGVRRPEVIPGKEEVAVVHVHQHACRPRSVQCAVCGVQCVVNSTG